MRASGVKTSIISAVESITPDSNAGGESFRHVDLGRREPGAITERVFEVELTGMIPSRLTEPSCQRVDYVLTVYYASYAGVEDRISDDVERIIKACSTLATGDLYSAEVSDAAILPSGAMDGMIEASLPVTVVYRRTGV